MLKLAKKIGMGAAVSLPAWMPVLMVTILALDPNVTRQEVTYGDTTIVTRVNRKFQTVNFNGLMSGITLRQENGGLIKVVTVCAPQRGCVRVRSTVNENDRRLWADEFEPRWI